MADFHFLRTSFFLVHPVLNIIFYLHFSGQYLVLATQETINIYLVMTGGMLGVVTRHYQPVTLLRSVQYHQYSTVSSVQYSNSTVQYCNISACRV